MTSNTLPPGGSPERSGGGSGLLRVISEQEETRFIKIQRKVGIEICSLFEALNPSDPFSLVFRGSFMGNIVKEAVLRSLGRTALPEGVSSSDSEKAYRTEEGIQIRQFMEVNTDNNFTNGIYLLKVFITGLKPYLQGKNQDEVDVDKEDRIFIGNVGIPLGSFKSKMEEDPRGLSLFQQVSIEFKEKCGVASADQAKKRGFEFADTLAVIAASEYSDRHISELTKLKPK